MFNHGRSIINLRGKEENRLSLEMISRFSAYLVPGPKIIGSHGDLTIPWSFKESSSGLSLWRKI
jgi:hypothetical protein